MENPVKGTHDIVGDEALMYREIETCCINVAKVFGYDEIRTPILEHTPLFLRSVGESSDIVHKEMYTFDDKGGRSITLRPEMTAGVMRSIVSNKLYALADLPMKYFYVGPCFRYERPQAGRYRQFHQFGVEVVGAPSHYLDAEVINMGYQCMVANGIEITVRLNSLGDEETRNRYREALREYFAEHIKNMCPDCQRRFEVNPLRILDCKVPEDIEIIKNAPKLEDYLSDNARIYLNQVIADLKEYNIEVEMDPNLVRGLDYYTGVVFEYHAKANPLIPDVGALGGGGHYAHLLKDVGGPDLEGVGLSLGLERMYHVFSAITSIDDLVHGLEVYVMPMGTNYISKAMNIVQELRRNGFVTDLSYEEKSFKAQFKTATRKNAYFAILLGEDEIKNNELTVKNLRTQEQTKINLPDLLNSMHTLMVEELGARRIIKTGGNE